MSDRDGDRRDPGSRALALSGPPGEPIRNDRPMKVRVAFTLSIDPEAYALAYGVGPEDLTEDVQTYAEGVIVELLGGHGLLAP